MRTKKPTSVRAWIVVLALFTAISFAAHTTRADDAPKAPAGAGKCMMWKVSSDTATVYLVGSIHLASQDMYPLPREMEEAFAKSKLLVVEVNMNKVDQEKMRQSIMETGMYQNGDTLSAKLSKESAKSLDEFCASIGVPEKAFDKLKPWVVSMTVEVMAIQKLGFDPKIGIDMHFLGLAEKNNIAIEELESAELQLKMLSGFDPDLQLKALTAMLEEMKDLKKDIGDIKEAWVAGDAKRVSDLLGKSARKHPELKEYQKRIFDQRNGPMAEKVEKYLKGNQTVFVIAGCGHMVGDKGIVKILQDHHFTVEQSKATREPEKKAE
jgi:uncharacterized protein